MTGPRQHDEMTDPRLSSGDSAACGGSSADCAARFAVLRPPGRDDDADRPTSADDAPRYEFGDVFARGGLGRIRTAFDRRLRRRVAVKELQHHRSGDPAEARFLREALITARLEHPAIIPIHDVGTHENGEPYYCMKLVEGRSLESLVRAARSLAERITLLPHVLAVADALAYAHEKGVVHRDLKPSNVLVGPFGETVIIDWGLAKDIRDEEVLPVEVDRGPVRFDVTQSLTRTGELLGTLPYMPLEQALSREVGPPADIYALGALLYFVLSGRPPYEGSDPTAIYQQILAGPPPDLFAREPAIPADLAAIVRHAMARSPEQRYPGAAELAGDLRRFQSGRMISARTYSPLDVLRYAVARYRAIVAVAGLSVLLLLGLGVLSYARISRAVAEAELQRQRAEESKDLADLRGTAAERAAERSRALASATLIDSARQYLFTQRRPDKALPALHEALKLAPDDRTTRMLLGEAMTTVDALHHEFVVSGGVNWVRFDPTGRRLLAVADDGEVHLWRLEDGASEPLAIDPATDAAEAEFVGPTGDALLVSAREGRALYFEHGAERWRRTGFARSVVPDGAPFALTYEDGALTEFTLAHGEPRAAWAPPWPVLYAQILSQAPAPHDAIVVAHGAYEETQGVYDRVSVLGWDSARGRASVLFRGYAHNKHSLAISHDGRWLSFVDNVDRGYADGHHYLAELGAGHPPLQLDRCESAEGNKPSGMAAVFSADDRRVVRLINRHTVVSWDIETRACVSKALLTEDNFDSIAASKDGRTIVAIGRNGTLAVLDGEDLTLKRQFSVGPAPLRDVALAHDGSMLATGDADGHVYVWALVDPRIVATHRMRGLAASWGSMFAAQNHEDESVSLYHVVARDDDEPPRPRAVGSRLAVERFNGTSQFVLAFDAGGHVSIWSRSTGEPLCEDVLLAERFSPDSSVGDDGRTILIAEMVNLYGPRPLPRSRIVSVDVATCSSSEPVLVPALGFAHLIPQVERAFVPAIFDPARFIDTTNGASLAALPVTETDEDQFATVFPDGRRVATGDGGGGIRVYDTISGDLLARLREPGATASGGIVSRDAAFFAPDRETFLTSSPEGPLDIWDPTTLEHRGQLRGHVRTVEVVEFSEDSTRAVSYSYDGFGDAAVYLWHLDGDDAGVRLPVEGVVRSEFSPRADILATGTRDGAVLLWDTDDGRLLGRLQGDDAPVVGLMFSGDWRYLVSASTEQSIVWRVSFETRSVEAVGAALASQARALGGSETRSEFSGTIGPAYAL